MPGTADQYTCGHIVPARGNQNAWEHCDVWVEGEVETDCPNFDGNALHAIDEVDLKCEECEYLMPPTSSESGDNERPRSLPGYLFKP